MNTFAQSRQTLAAYLLSAQLLLLGAIGLLAILAPTTLLFRFAWWGCISIGSIVTILCLIGFSSSREKFWLYLLAASLLTMGAASPSELWLIGL